MGTWGIRCPCFIVTKVATSGDCLYKWSTHSGGHHCLESVGGLEATIWKNRGSKSKEDTEVIVIGLLAVDP